MGKTWYFDLFRGEQELTFKDVDLTKTNWIILQI